MPTDRSTALPSSATLGRKDGTAAGLRIVAIGGGTGLSTLLKGLRDYVCGATNPKAGACISDLTAVVTVTDDGGSSGRLRKELNILPPGDIRNCIVALSEDQALLARLFQYRFEGVSALKGHNFGNLFLAALAGVTGDFAEAVKLSSEILATRGHIYPATTANVELEAMMQDGSRVRGETSITASQKGIHRLEMAPPDVPPMQETLEALANADLISIGPGSLFTSLIPNVLVRGIPEAIANSTAIKVYVCNLMTQANESLGLSASDHIRAIYDHAGCRIFDVALVNSTPATPEMKAKYALEGASQIVASGDKIRELGVEPVFGDYLFEENGVARHAFHTIAADLVKLAESRPALSAIKN